ncbi:MAG TPA: hypothetical protein HA262_01160 [Methanosarcina sp.]|jgi:hypothetical protein|nr:hypothetical protein [Methanosarcina sp.]
MSLNKTQSDKKFQEDLRFSTLQSRLFQYKKSVLQLSNRSRREGIDCIVGQYEMSPEGLSRWIVNQIEKADFVFVVCIENYKKWFKGKEEAGKRLGTK